MGVVSSGVRLTGKFVLIIDFLLYIYIYIYKALHGPHFLFIKENA